ncbi:hypothetical protein BGX28_008820 [Mortierella sp. GBA30]|nr:hypothetical protein BGX28_008820 [Mortierella sp. GBA30]
MIEQLYLLCFISTRLIYVTLLWHEIFYNYPDKSVAFLYTITISLHVYWFVLYLQNQKKYRAKQRRLQLAAAAAAAEQKQEPTASASSSKPVAIGQEEDMEVLESHEDEEVDSKTYNHLHRSDRITPGENRSSIELEERDHFKPLLANNSYLRSGHHEL